jgi:hypothetical protein
MRHSSSDLRAVSAQTIGSPEARSRPSPGFDKFGLSQFLNCERRPDTATVPQPRNHVATIAKVISATRRTRGGVSSSLVGRLEQHVETAQIAEGEPRRAAWRLRLPLPRPTARQGEIADSRLPRTG